MTLKRWIRTLIAAAGLAGTGLAACAVGNLTGLSVPTRTLDAQIALIEAHSAVRYPASAEGPVPAALLFHGCGGLRQVQADYGAALREAGFAVITVDSNTPRGIGRFEAMTQVCTAQRLLGQERAADITAAIALARRDPRIDSERLAIIGWSHGGWSVLDALGYAGEGLAPASLENIPGGMTELPGVRAAVAVYPYCGFPVRTDGRAMPDIPLHVILAGRDIVAPPGACSRLFERMIANGFSVEAETWPDVTHAFDEPNQPPDPRMEYDADAAARARARIVEILERELAAR